MRPVQGHAVVLCDANVLYGQWLRDLVMWLGSEQLIQPRWSERIEREWLENLLAHRPDLPRERVERTAALMNRALPHAKTEVPASAQVYALPDPDDVHVLQAAVTARATLLLTFNLADFPADICRKAGVTAIHPDQFLVALAKQHPQEMRRTLELMRRQKLNPPVTWAEMAQTFAKAGLPNFAATLEAMGSNL